jgi:tetratricopeptide (TPR) repeat protein
LSQIALLLRLYISPLKTFSRILDEGRLIFAALAAITVVLALQVPRQAQYERDEYKAMMRAFEQRVHNVTSTMREKGEQKGREQLSEEMQEYYADLMESARRTPTFERVVDSFTAVNPTNYFSPLVAMAICFMPIAILILARLECLGSFSMILQRDYSALLACVLFSWTASYLLLLVVNLALLAMHSPAHNHPALWWGAHAYFLLLAALAMRMNFGAKLTSALGATAGAWGGAVGGIWLYAVVGNPLAYVASPCLLYYLYVSFAPGVTSLGSGLGARQRLKKGLQEATLNPADFDAHTQLGLIYAQRRQFDSAAACFRKAIEVGPNEPEAYYQLGRMAREQGRYSEALELCHTAARLDDKHSSSEVWREIGIANYLEGDSDAARQAMEKYLDRRPYDPEALCWYGRVLARLERPEAAREAFTQAIEAVRTMPAPRRRKLRSWESEAAREMKKLPAAMKVGA